MACHGFQTRDGITPTSTSRLYDHCDASLQRFDDTPKMTSQTATSQTMTSQIITSQATTSRVTIAQIARAKQNITASPKCQPTSRRSVIVPDECCAICGDRSSGRHYGQLTCEGCKSFFKRSVRRGLSYACKGAGSCPVDRHQRNQCQRCRLVKCLCVGMKTEAVQQSRQASFTPSSVCSGSGLDVSSSTTDTNPPPHLDGFLSALTHFDTCPLAPQTFTPPHHYTANPLPVYCHPAVSLAEREDDTLSEMAARLLFSAVQWTRGVFVSCARLSGADQVALLRRVWSELFVLNAAQWLPMTSLQSNVNPLRGAPCALTRGFTEGRVDQSGGYVEQLVDPTHEFYHQCERIRALSLDATEYSFLKGIVLFNSDAPGLSDTAQVDRLQERCHCLLDAHLRLRHGAFASPKRAPGGALGTTGPERARFGRLLLRLGALRDVQGALIERMFFVRLVGRTSIDALVRDLLLGGSGGGGGGVW